MSEIEIGIERDMKPVFSVKWLKYQIESDTVGHENLIIGGKPAKTKEEALTALKECLHRGIEYL